MSTDFRVLRVAEYGAGFNGYAGVREKTIWFKNRVNLKELRMLTRLSGMYDL